MFLHISVISIFTQAPKWMKRLQNKVEHGQLHEMAAAFGAPALGILLANPSEAISRPGGAMEISRWWSEAQPPGQVEEDCSRPGRDAGQEFATRPIPVRRPFRARVAIVAFPAATLRSTAG